MIPPEVSLAVVHMYLVVGKYLQRGVTLQTLTTRSLRYRCAPRLYVIVKKVTRWIPTATDVRHGEVCERAICGV